MKIVEMTTKDLEYDTSRQSTSLRELTSILKEVLLWVNFYQTAVCATEKQIKKGRIDHCSKLQSDFPGGSVVKNPPAIAEDAKDVSLIPGWVDPLAQEMATHFSMLSWKIPWTEEPDGLKSMGS